MIKTIQLTAKCGDCFSADFIDESGDMAVSYTGYVPDFSHRLLMRKIITEIMLF